MNLPIKNLYSKLKERHIDAILVSSNPNISYLTNYPSRDSYLLVSEKENIYITDSRYLEEAKRNLKDCTILKSNGSVFEIIADSCNKLKVRRVAFEERNLSFGEYKRIKGQLNRNIKLLPTHSLVEKLREIKDEDELEKIRKATQIAIQALRFTESLICAGKREIEVAGEIQRFIRYNGASSSSFEIIVASGCNSSYPHYITSSKKIKENEPVMVDLGVDYQGYKSDLTRVIFAGKINALVKEIYSIVLEAQARAIKEIKPGISIGQIDAAAREFIAQKGYKKFFGHALGHGIGLEVHEEPHIAGEVCEKLKAGMVFTVEPAIYLPGRFGIRIEDMVLVTEKGNEVLSGALHK